jgi:hypothetical protein
MAKYVVRTNPNNILGDYTRGDIIENPSVIPENLLVQHCTRVPDSAFPDAGKPAAKAAPAEN